MNEPKGKNEQKDRRADRRARALRENLKRRKAQARGRAEAEKKEPKPRASHDPARPGENSGRE
jgi:hypothetical protein